MKTFFFKLSIILSSIAFFIVFAELYFRLFNPQPIVPRYVEVGPYGIRKNIGNVKGKMITAEYMHEFTTNTEGFRSTKDYLVMKPFDVYRVVVLGDSMTMGLGVGDDETFSIVLERLLARKRQVEVINMGVAGFGTAEELIELREVGLKYAPDIIILAYFQNDPYNDTVSKLFRMGNDRLVRDEKSFVPAIYIRDRLYNIPGYSLLSQHSHAINFIRIKASTYFIKKLGAQANVFTHMPVILNTVQKKLTGALLNEIMKEARTHGIPLIILDIPALSSDGKKLFTNLPREKLSASSGAYILDAGSLMLQGCPIEDLYYPVDSHLKPLGHRLIAQGLASFIEKELW